MKHLRTIIATSLFSALVSGCASSAKPKDTDAVVSSTADTPIEDDSFLTGSEPSAPKSSEGSPVAAAEPAAPADTASHPTSPETTASGENEMDALFGEASTHASNTPPPATSSLPEPPAQAMAPIAAAAVTPQPTPEPIAPAEAPIQVNPEPITLAAAPVSSPSTHTRGPKRILFSSSAQTGFNPLHIAWTQEANPSALGLECELKAHSASRQCVTEGVVVTLHDSKDSKKKHLEKIYLDTKGSETEARWHQNLRDSGYLYAGTRTRKDGMQVKRFMSYDHSTHADLIWNEKDQAVTLKLFPTAKGLGAEGTRQVASEAPATHQ